MITSRQNEKIKFIKSLSNKKVRDESGLYVVEGVKIVKEAFKMKQKVKTVVCTEKGLKLLGEVDVDTLVVSDDVFSAISDEKSPQGVMAIIEKTLIPLRSPQGKCLFLDGVSDPNNVGAILRTAAASGYNDVYVAIPSADPYGPKTARVSMSGLFAVNVFEGEREELLSFINCPIYVADMNGEDVFSFKSDKTFCLVIGNEGHGISLEVRKKAKKTISIPMQNGIESLNAGVSAGILMYALKNS